MSLQGAPSTHRSDPSPALRQRYQEIRAVSEALTRPLSPEDATAQSMPDASPAKWHLAHTTWFFETFVLEAHEKGFEPFSPAFRVLFNSYYNTVGEQHARPERGLITRPGLEEVRAYRRDVDERMARLLDGPGGRSDLAPLVEIGLNHEQQHQELLLTDVKHLLSRNPLHPAYTDGPSTPGGEAAPLEWHRYAEGIREIGHEGDGFAFDNESPRHRTFLEPFELSSRLVTNEEYLAFVADRGYERPDLWLSEGWAAVNDQGWRSPLYWFSREKEWFVFTLTGDRPLRGDEPVCHLSFFEADAFARWSDARLPTEAEWEIAARDAEIRGNFVDEGHLHPVRAGAIESSARERGPAQLFGDVWEWTQSPYTPYPGYRPLPGSLGEYNGKFMCNQMVLRGGSCATARDHVRRTYRNFFPPGARWQFMGLRLARTAR